MFTGDILVNIAEKNGKNAECKINTVQWGNKSRGYSQFLSWTFHSSIYIYTLCQTLILIQVLVSWKCIVRILFEEFSFLKKKQAKN